MVVYALCDFVRVCAVYLWVRVCVLCCASVCVCAWYVLWLCVYCCNTTLFVWATQTQLYKKNKSIWSGIACTGIRWYPAILSWNWMGCIRSRRVSIMPPRTLLPETYTSVYASGPKIGEWCVLGSPLNSQPENSTLQSTSRASKYIRGSRPTLGGALQLL